MNDRNENTEQKPKVKSIIIDSELKEWEEWGNRYFGNGEYGDDTYTKDDLKNKKRN